MAIYDCFTFLDELDLLYARLVELYPVVDHFVVVEATQTFQGVRRALVFEQHRDDFAAFLDKIIYVPVSDLPGCRNPSINEYAQRNAIRRGLRQLKETDLVILSDVDEIPRREIVAHLPSVGIGDIRRLSMRFFYYGLNWEMPYRWRSAAIVCGATMQLLSPQEIRLAHFREEDLVDDAGWHFSYFYPRAGVVEGIRRKVHSFQHSEFANPRYLGDQHLRLCIGGGLNWMYEPRYITKLRFRTVDRTFPVAIRHDVAGRFIPYATPSNARDIRLECEAWVRHAYARLRRPILDRLPRLKRLGRVA